MHVGLVGTGRIGALHARNLKDNPLVSRLTVVDADQARAAAVATAVGADQMESPQALLNSGLDAVIIAAATPAHAELLHLAADAAVPAFCEKPIALDLAATDKVIEHVRRSGILVQIGFQRRFDAGYRAARDAVVSGSLGDVQVVRLATHDPAPPPEEYIAGFTPRQSGDSNSCMGMMCSSNHPGSGLTQVESDITLYPSTAAAQHAMISHPVSHQVKITPVGSTIGPNRLPAGKTFRTSRTR